MRFPMPYYPAEFEIPDEWLGDISFPVSLPASGSFRSFPTAKIILLAEIEPPLRYRTHPKDWNGFEKARLVSLLKAMATGVELPPVPIAELPVFDFPQSPYRFRVRDGYHRFYASLAAGFSSLPVSDEAL